MKTLTFNSNIFFDDRKSSIYILNEQGETLLLEDDVSMFIWRIIEKNKSTEVCGIIEEIKQKFILDSINESDLEKDISLFISDLLKNGLLIESVH
jgi:hypothetical protein